MNHRPLLEIAAEIIEDWTNIRGEAKSYAEAMMTLRSIHDSYGLDSAVEIVSRFLGQSATWKGAVAQRIKAELRGVLAVWDGERARGLHVA